MIAKSDVESTSSYGRSVSDPRTGTLTPSISIHKGKSTPLAYFILWSSIAVMLLGHVALAQSDETAPELDEATLNGSTLTLTYDETLDTTSVPAVSDFTVRIQHLTITVTAVTVSGSEVTLTLMDAVPGGPDGEIDYTPGTSPIRDAAENAAVALDDEDVENEGDLPEVTISTDQTSVTEGEEFEFTLSRTGPTLFSLWVGISRTRTDTRHRFFPKSSYRIPPGSSETTFTVPFHDDAEMSDDGTFTVSVKNSGRYDVGDDNSVTVDALDDGDVYVSAYLQAGTTRGYEAQINATIQVWAIQDPGPDRPPDTFSFVVTTRPQTALPGEDYLTRTRPFTFRPAQYRLRGARWQAVQRLHIPLVDDNIPEPDETFLVGINRDVTTPAAVDIPATFWTYTIRDDDGLITISVESDRELELTEGGEAVNLRFIARTDDPRAEPFEVKFLVGRRTGTANPGTHITFGDSTNDTATVKFSESSFKRVFHEHELVYESTQTLTLKPVDDNLVEPDKTLGLFLRNQTTVLNANRVILPDEDLQIRITEDDEPNWAVKVSRSVIAEDGGEATVRVETGGVAFPDDRKIRLRFTGGTATHGDDFVVADTQGTQLSSPWELDLESGSEEIRVTITGVDDALTEGEETIRVGALYDGNEVGSAEIRIADDENPATRIILSSDPDAVREDAGATSLAVTGTLNGAPIGQEVTAQLEVTSVTADLNDDFTAGTATLTIGAQDTTGVTTLTLTPVDDDEYEGDETVRLKGLANHGLVVESTLVTIREDDVPAVSIAATKTAVTEGTDSFVEFTFSRTGSTHTALTALATILIDDGGQFTTLPPGFRTTAAVRFLPDESTATLRYTIHDDNVDEPDGGITATLQTSSAYDISGLGFVSVTIVDDDLTPELSATFDQTSVKEGGTLTLTVSSSNGSVFSNNRVVRLNLNDSSTAVRDADYTISAHRSGVQTATSLGLRLEAGADSLTAHFVTLDDTDIEEDETISVSLSYGEDETDLGTFELTVRNDDVATWSISSSPNKISENFGRSTVTISTGGATFESDQTIPLLFGGTAVREIDYRLRNQDDEVLTGTSRLTLASGHTTTTAVVEALDDELVEGDEVVQLWADPPDDSDNVTTEITIGDDELMSDTVIIGVRSSLDETAGETELTVGGTLNRRPLTEDVVVSVSVNAGTATETTDYTAGTATLTIPAGVDGSTTTLTFTPVDDRLDEPDETVIFGGTATGGLSVTSEEMLIIDDDIPRVHINRSSLAVTEGGRAASYNVVLDTVPTESVTVSVTVDEGADDITVNPSALTFDSTNWNTIQQIGVTAVDDDLDEGTESAALSHSVSGYGDVTSADGVAVQITDNDTAGVTVSKALLTVTEGAAAMSYTVVLDSEPTATVTVTVEGGGDDLTTNPSVLTFTSNNWETAQAVSVTAVDDTLGEGRELVFLTHAVSGYGTITSASSVGVSIIDNDMSGVTVGPTSLTVLEGFSDPSSYTVVLDSEPSGPVMVAVGGDWAGELTVQPNRLMFSTTNWNDAQTVNLTAVDDAVDEDTEAVMLNHAVSGYPGVLTAEGVTVNITDNDTAGVTVTPTSISVTEGGSDVIYSLVLDSQPSGSVIVTVGGGGGEVSVDPSSLTFNATNWDTAQEVSVSAVDDSEFENETDVTLTHTVSGYGSVTSASDVTVTVSDDDEPDWSVTVSPAQIAEGSSSTFTVSTGGATFATDQTIALDLAGSTATAGTDFTLKHGNTTLTQPYELTLTAGQSSVTATISATEENDDDGDETVAITARREGTQLDQPRTITILDDDTAVEIGVSVPESVSEDDGTFTINVTLTTTENRAPTVDFGGLRVATEDGSAKSTSDYSSLSRLLALNRTDFAANESATAFVATRSVTVTLTNDSIIESEEDFFLRFSPPITTNSLILRDGNVFNSAIVETVKIENDDEPTWTVTASPNQIAENGGTATLTVSTGSSSFASDQTIALDLTGSTATVGEDFTISSGGEMLSTPYSLTLPIGSTSITATITAKNDELAEVDESIVISTRHVGSQVGTQQTISITDDDQASTSITLSTSLNTVAEAAGATEIAISAKLNADAFPTDTEISLLVAAGTATVTDDYTATTATLTISAGATIGLATLTLTPVNDAIDESNETVMVTGSANNLTVSSVEITIVDDDARGVTVSKTQLEFAEGTSATYTIVLDSQPTASVTVAITKATGSDADVTVSPESLTYTTSNWNTAQTVTVSSGEDTDSTNDTATVNHAVSGGDYGANSITADSVSVTVTDNETASTKITLSVNPDEVAESAGATTLTVTATLDGAPFAADTEVSLSVTAGTATATDDYAAGTATLTITGGNTTGTATLTLTPVNDALVEGDETVTVGGSVDSLTVTGIEVTITDDDTRGVTVSQTALTFGEGGNGQYTVVLNSQPTGNVNVSVTVDGDSDVTVSSSNLAFTTSNWNTTQTITVSAAQDSDAEDDSATVEHTVSGADYGSNNVTADSVSITVTDDETASTGVTLSVVPSSVDEGAGATELTITGTLDGASLHDDVAVSLSVGGGTAAQADYSAGTTSLTITAGQTTGTAKLTLTPVDDDLAEVNTTVTVQGTTTSVLTVTSATVTITDDDTRGVAVSETALTVAEGSTATYTLTLESEPTAPVTVTTSVDGDSDVTVTPTSVTFTSANWSTSQTMTVSGGDDTDAEDDSATVEHTVSGGDYGDNGVTADSVSVTITDDETASTEVDLSVTPVSIMESAGTTTLRVTGQLNASTFTGSTEVSLSVSTGTATVADFAAGTATLTITAGQSNAAATLTLTPVNDDVDEDAETVSIGGTASRSLIVNTATVTITDDDTRGVTISETALTFDEGSSADYTVVLDSQPTSDVSIAITAEGDADISVSPTNLTFTPSNWNSAQTVTVNGAEDDDGNHDLATVKHAVTGADYGANTVTATSVNVRVTDTEVPATVVNLSVTPSTVQEDAGMTVLVVTGELNGAALTSDTIVTVSASPGTATAADYAADSATLTIAEGQKNATANLSLIPVDDAVDEEDETLTLAGATTQMLTVVSTEVTIEDDDTRGVTLSKSSLTFGEGGNGQYTVVLDSQPTDTVMVSVMTSGDTDVTAVPRILTFAPSNWTTARTVTVSSAHDADAADDTATVDHVVSGGDYGDNKVVPDSLLVTVTDDERASEVITLSVVPDSVYEGTTNDLIVTGTLDAAPFETDITVTLSIAPVTASVEEFTAQIPTLTIAAGQTSGTATLSLTVQDDLEEEGDETVEIRGNITGLSVTAAEVTIDDDEDETIIRFVKEFFSLKESENRGLMITVELTRALDHSVTIPVVWTHLSADESDYNAKFFPWPPPFETLPEGKPSEVTFSAEETRRILRIEPVDDEVNEPQEERLDVELGTPSSEDVTVGIPGVAKVTIHDNDGGEPGVSVTPTKLSVLEGRSVSYKVALDAPPTAAVTLTVRVDVDSDAALTIAPASLTFNTDSWSDAQTVTVSAAQDDDSDDDTAILVHSVRSVDVDYDAIETPSVSVAIRDDDIDVGVSVCADEVDIPEGGSATCTVVLDAAPIADVVVGMFVDPFFNPGFTLEPEIPTPRPPDFVFPDGEVYDTLTFVTFTPTNWDTPQTVTVHAPAEDTDGVEEEHSMLRFVVALSEDPVYDALTVNLSTIASVRLNTIDPDARTGTPAVNVSTTQLTVPAAGATSYRLGMDGDFTGSVYVNIASNDPGVWVHPGTVYFNRGNWDVEQHVTVGAGDGVANATLTHSIDANRTTGAVLQSVESVTVTVGPKAVLSVEDTEATEGLTATIDFRVTLSPAATVTVTVDYATADGTATSPEDYVAKRGTLTFAPDESEKTVEVPLHDDRVEDDGETFTLTLANANAADISDAEATGTIRNKERGGSAPNSTVNAEATGVPTISGITRVGHTLTAVITNIADSDGIQGAEFLYQWTRSGNYIEGATQSIYELAIADEGELIAVIVSFTDDVGHSESLTSDPTIAIEARLPPLTASFSDVPTEHDGNEFSFTLTFSEAPKLSYVTLRDEALHVLGATVSRARRQQAGSNLTWTITVDPVGHDDVIVTLRGTDVIHTHDGRSLSNSPSVTVHGPPTLSVSDAQANEGMGSSVVFPVELNRSPSSIVTVDYATADGTATAGTDYTATDGTLTFAIGQRILTVSVPVLDDGHDEGQESFSFFLSSASGALIADGTAIGTIVNSDPMPQAWLSKFGSTASDHALQAIDSRIQDGRGKSHLIIGGRSMGRFVTPHTSQTRLNGSTDNSLANPSPVYSKAPIRDVVVSRDAHLDAGQHSTGSIAKSGGESPGDSSLNVQIGDPRVRIQQPNLSDSSFVYSLLADEDGQTNESDWLGNWTTWGRIAVTRFSDTQQKLSLNGEVATVTLGMDSWWNRVQGGVAISYSEGEGSYTLFNANGGDLSSTLTNVTPFTSYALSDSTSVWSVLGYGVGKLSLTSDGEESSLDTKLTNTMAAFGARSVLSILSDKNGAFEFAIRSDSMVTNTVSDAVQGLVDATGITNRIRLMLEGKGNLAFGADSSITPTLEAGFRYDEGDGDAGVGIEVGTGLGYSVGRFSVRINASGLIAYKGADYEEWGFNGAIQFQPLRDGLGIHASLDSSWGNSRANGGSLWTGIEPLGISTGAPLSTTGHRFTTHLGYGLESPRSQRLWVPFLGAEFFEGTQARRMGLKFASGTHAKAEFEFGDRLIGRGEIDYTLKLGGSIWW